MVNASTKMVARFWLPTIAEPATCRPEGALEPLGQHRAGKLDARAIGLAQELAGAGRGQVHTAEASAVNGASYRTDAAMERPNLERSVGAVLRWETRQQVPGISTGVCDAGGRPYAAAPMVATNQRD
jgi:hypothetical protein